MFPVPWIWSHTPSRHYLISNQSSSAKIRVECWLGSAYTSLLRLKEIPLQPWIFPKCSHSRTWASLNAIFFVRYSRPYLLVVVQSLSHVWLFATPWTAARQAPMSFTISWSLLKFMSNWVSDAIQPSHPLSSPSPPAPNPSQHQSLFQWVNSSNEVAKVLEIQLRH